MKNLTITLARVKNTAAGGPRFKVVNTNDIDTLTTLANNKIYFKKLKSGIYTVPNGSFSYAICDGYTAKVHGLDVVITTYIK